MEKAKFSRDEDGALLVFFAMCVAAVFLIAALSFDLGRRASTQTELQSFADNVALAAAGELNGFDGAIARSTKAANELIADKFTFGEGDTTLSGPADFTLIFYETLPDDETQWATALDQVPANDARARFVRVQVTPVEVPWVFARILSIFSSDPLPSENVAAEATGGYTSLACDIAPVFFCLPDGTADDGTTSDGGFNDWDPANHIGDQVLLRTGQGGNSFWDSGNFGWLDVRENIPEDSIVAEYGACAGLTGSPLLTCLIAAENGVTTCFENGLLTTLPGQKQGIESAVFNTRFDMFNATVSQYASNSTFQPAPLIKRGFVDSSGDACLRNSVLDVDTMPFPQDDCFDSGFGGSTAGCDLYDDGRTRYGDGDWSVGRNHYVEANFSIDGESYGSFSVDDPLTTEITEPTEIITTGAAAGYHVDDPFRPRTISGDNDIVLYNKPTVVGPGTVPAATRFEYYVAEVIVTYWSELDGYVPGDTPKAAFESYLSSPDGFFPDGFTVNIPEDAGGDPISMMPSLEFDDGSKVARVEDGFPQCAPNADPPGGFSIDPRRRTVVAAVVDCSEDGVNGGITGKDKEVKAKYFIESFITRPVKGDPTDKKKFDMWIEVIGPALNTGDDVIETGRFQNLIQLYR